VIGEACEHDLRWKPFRDAMATIKKDLKAKTMREQYIHVDYCERFFIATEF